MFAQIRSRGTTRVVLMTISIACLYTVVHYRVRRVVKSPSYLGGERVPTREDVPMGMVLPTHLHCVDDDHDGIQSCIAVPANPEDYLSRVYGKGWQTPLRFHVLSY